LHALHETSWSADLDTKVLLSEYWLLKTLATDPNSDQAARFLLSNLHRLAGVPTIVNIAQNELTSHPTLFTLIAVKKCLCEIGSTHALSQVLRIRWDAACHVQDYKTIFADYQLFSERYFDHRDTWEGVTVTTINLLMWSSENDIQRDCDEMIANPLHF